MTPAQRRAVAQELHAAAIRLLRRLRSEDVAMGLSSARASILSLLVFVGPKSPGALAALEQVKPPTMTKLVQGLERDGLVRCAADPGDARAVIVTATAAGRKLLEEGRRRRVEALSRLLAPLGDRAFGTLAAATRHLTGLLQEKKG